MDIASLWLAAIPNSLPAGQPLNPPCPPSPPPSASPVSGLYTELDFRNEALNARRMRELLDASDSGAGARVVIPAPVLELTTRCVTGDRGLGRFGLVVGAGRWGLGVVVLGVGEGAGLGGDVGMTSGLGSPGRQAAAARAVRPPGCAAHAPLTHRACRRRVLVMEWVTGVKLTTLEPPEIRSLVGVGQEAFLVQLLEVGFIHGDPHPGGWGGAG